MKNKKKPFNARLGLVIGLALLLLLSVTLQTSGGAAKYRSQVVVSGTIKYTQPAPVVTEPEEPENTQPEEPENTQPEEPENTQPEEPENTQPEEPENTQPEEPENTQPEEP